MKRKRPTLPENPSHDRPSEVDLSHFVIVQEAVLITDQPLRAAAVTSHHDYGGTSTAPQKGLVNWKTTSGSTDEEGDIWVDRFDVRLLVTSLPTSISTSAPSAIHPEIDETWEDLPSDAEDNFFLSPEEVKEYRLRKRLELMERNRLERIRQAEESEAANLDPTGDIWGESDEEPDAAQLTLMSRTANHVATSPNPALLEMRILANHGADQRFAFLRGRWKKRWAAIKAEVARGKDPAPATSGSDGLVGYGSEDSDDEAKANTPNGQELEREAKRARLKAWTEKRRKEIAGADAPK